MQKVPKPPIYQLARLCGCSFPELADYTELEACAWHCLCYFFPLPLSLPLLSTPPSWHESNLSPTNPLWLLSHLTAITCFIIIFLTPPWCFWHLTFLPLTPGRILTYTCFPKLPPQAPSQARFPRRNWELWTVEWGAWRWLFGSSCYTSSGFSVKETVLPSALSTAIWLYVRSSPFLLQLGSDP